MRHRADSNQDELREVFERMGCSVINLSQVGNGCPDLAVSLHGFTDLVEVKTEAGKFTPEQIRFHRESKATIHEARTAQDCVRIVAKLKQRMREML